LIPRGRARAWDCGKAAEAEDAGQIDLYHCIPIFVAVEPVPFTLFLT